MEMSMELTLKSTASDATEFHAAALFFYRVFVYIQITAVSSSCFVFPSLFIVPMNSESVFQPKCICSHEGVLYI